MNRRLSLTSFLLITLGIVETTTNLRAEISSFAADKQRLVASGLVPTAVGVTRRGTSIDAVLAPEDLNFGTTKTRILLVAGASGDKQSALASLSWMRWFYEHAEAAKHRERFVLSVVPTMNPDGNSYGNSTAANGDVKSPGRYPPQGDAYGSPNDPEAVYVWRWIGMHAPDLVVELTPGDKIRWCVPRGSAVSLAKLISELQDVTVFDQDKSLVAQLSTTPPCDTGTIPALKVSVSATHSHALLESMLNALVATKYSVPSPARLEMQRRLARTPDEISDELLEIYGKQLQQVVYIQSLAVIGRMRQLERIAAVSDQGLDYASIDALVKDYFDGSKVAALKTGSDLSGHLVFSELANRASGDRRLRYIELARSAADLAFNDRGDTNPSMPFHSEMSDALFMGAPILAQVGMLTGESKYFDACAQHLRFMRALDFRSDNLYRHSPLDESAWGRGNGFPALGVAMCLDAFPDAHPDRPELLTSFQQHMAALAGQQDPTGCWHQIIDHPESYREFTATCMIAYAMIRGVSNGWLAEDEYLPVIDRAWYAIRTRIGTNGELVDVCTGTGKQKSLRNYYDRTAILGRDDRGGAMALLVTNEIESWQRRSRRSLREESK